MTMERSQIDTSKVTRVEIIDHTKEGRGRVYTFWNQYNKKDIENPRVTVHLQDEGRTLKIFIHKHITST
jgi:hypothetical protein